ncbi:MAG: BlaI/MecI/CopY family transcriptional regulator [Gemmatimonadota bacterium]|nr:BlaI/MecI/CopY family transcriptional regulator [Gemmatimonadota bacterium]
MQLRLTDRELDIMTVLWDRDSGTVAEVRAVLADPLAYTTVLSVLQTLEDKGFVGHVEEGKAHRYRPLVERGAAEKSAVNRLVSSLFEGSPELLMTHLMTEQPLTPAEAKRLRMLLDDRLKGDSR